MKVILEPTVTLVAKQVFIEHPVYKIPADGNDAVKIGAFAAKGCYDSYGEDGRPNEANQRQVVEQMHGSVLEHITATLFLEGISRALSLESNRHRQNAISQRSTRYTEEGNSAIVLEPFYASLANKFKDCIELNVPYEDETIIVHKGNSSFLGNDDDEYWLYVHFLEAAERAIDIYESQVETLIHLNPLNLKGHDLRKWARGKARNILPHCLETRITYTGNLRAWRWFVESRSSRFAEPEIRRLADKVLTELRLHFTLYFEDFENVGNYDGIPEWVPKYHKV
jgi:thymidylate synthase (FAD)